MKRTRFVYLGVVVLLFLAACSPAAEGAKTVSSGQEVPSGEGMTAGSESSRLDQEFDGALSVQGQLAAGTLLLEDTDLAVDSVLAGELLTLWQAVQSLSDSDTAAAVEIQAVLNQIQDTMRPEQVAAIAGMRLTEESLTEMLEAGTLALGPGGFGADQGTEGAGPGGAFGGFGGGPPGGFGGGPQGGGPPGGEAGFGGQGFDPDTIATRRAEFSDGDAANFQERAMLGAVIRLLGTKTGEAPAGGRGGIFGVIFEVAAEATGLTAEEIQTQMADGTTLAEIIEANGADVSSVRMSLIDAFDKLPNAIEMDLEQLADQWLALEQ